MCEWEKSKWNWNTGIEKEIRWHEMEQITFQILYKFRRKKRFCIILEGNWNIQEFDQNNQFKYWDFWNLGDVSLFSSNCLHKEVFTL